MRSLLAAVAVLVCTVAGLVTTASPAVALPQCQGMSVYGSGSGPYEKPTTYNNTRNTQCVLGVGSTTSAVWYLQETLRRCYGQGIRPDGVYGSRTAQAVRNVQAFHRVGVDGVFGPRTSAPMFWHLYYDDARCTYP